MKKLLYLTIAIGFLVSFNGCASTISNCQGWLSNVRQNQPVRRTIRSWFQGEACDTCNTPAGQSSFGTNVAPLCNDCGPGGQGLINGVAPGGPLFTDPNLGATANPTVTNRLNADFPPADAPINSGSGTTGSSAPTPAAPIYGTGIDPVTPPAF